MLHILCLFHKPNYVTALAGVAEAECRNGICCLSAQSLLHRMTPLYSEISMLMRTSFQLYEIHFLIIVPNTNEVCSKFSLCKQTQSTL